MIGKSTVYRFYFIVGILSFAFWGCEADIPTGNDIGESSSEEPSDSLNNMAIVVLVENGGQIDRNMQQGYEENKAGAVLLLSSLFKVPADSIAPLSFEEMMEVYAEPFQLERITALAQRGYGKVIGLTDENADLQHFLDTLVYLKASGYTTDVLFSLHANEEIVRFNDGTHAIQTITQSVKERGIRIRCLYQTCCTSAPHIAHWEEAGVNAVNGAAGINVITMFSPLYFLEEWMSGANFETAVQTAFDREVGTIKTYSNLLPVDEYFLTENNLLGSDQHVGGTTPGIYFKKESE